MALNDLEVRVSADTRGLSQGLRRARREQERFAREQEREQERIRQRRSRIGQGVLRQAGGFGSFLADAEGGQFAGVGRAGVAAAGLAAVGQRARRATTDVGNLGREWRQMSLFQSEALTRGQAQFRMMMDQNMRMRDSFINATSRGAGFFARAVAGGVSEQRSVGAGQIAEGLVGGLQSLITQDFASARQRLEQFVGGTLLTFGPGTDAITERRRRFAQAALNQRRRVTGAAERGTQAEAAVFSGIIANQLSGNRFELQRIAMILEQIRQEQQRQLLGVSQ